MSKPDRGLSGCPNMQYVNAQNNSLTALDISANPLLIGLDASNNLLDQATVDAILLDLAEGWQTGGNLNLSGTYNAAPSNANFIMMGHYVTGNFSSSPPNTITQSGTGTTATFLFDSPTAFLGGGYDTGGPFTPGDLITQAVTGATATYMSHSSYFSGPIVALISGCPDDTNVWTDGSGNSFTPNAPVGSFIAVSALSGTDGGSTSTWTDGSGNVFYEASGAIDYIDFLIGILGWTVTVNSATVPLTITSSATGTATLTYDAGTVTLPLPAGAATVNLPSTITFVEVTTNSTITDVDFSALGSGVNTVETHGLSSLASVDLTGLSGITTIYVDSCPLLTSLDMQGLTALTTANLGNTGLTSVNLTGCSSLYLLSCGHSPLTTIDISTNPALIALYLNNNALTQAAVDAVLAQLVTNGLTGGGVNMTGGINSTPSEAGFASIATLASRGWVVSVN